jgi:prophage antirepressor-like protein
MGKNNDKDYTVGKDITKCLGYINPRDASSRHCRGVVKHDIWGNYREKEGWNRCYSKRRNECHSRRRHI